MDGNPTGSTTTDGQGNYTYNLASSGLGNGVHSVIAADTNVAGTVGDSSPLIFTYEGTPPEVSIALADDTSNGQDITTDGTLKGSAPDAVSVALTLADGTPLATVTPDAGGNFTYTPSSADGTYTVDAVATDWPAMCRRRPPSPIQSTPRRCR